MKKLISLILSAAMLVGMAPAALAADNPLGDTLTVVTEKVKAQLNIGNSYTIFHGTAQDNGLNEDWNLLWEKEDGTRLSIDATTAGKIMRYTFSTDADNYRYGQDFAPAFPKLSRENARGIAKTFLDKVLDKTTETFSFRENDSDIPLQNTENYYFTGTVKLNGLDSPFRFTICVNMTSKAVTNFSRNDKNNKFIGSVPSAKPSATKDAASKLLHDAIQMKLEYTTSTENTDNGQSNKAVLRYFPIHAGNYMVDAQSGKLVNLDDAYRIAEDSDSGMGMGSAATENAQSKSGLSQAEQAGIDKLSGVLSKDKLDAKIRAMSELGLSDFTLADTYYSANDNDDDYFCNLTYAKTNAEKQITRKYAYVNAKSGELISLGTSYPFAENKVKGNLSRTEAQKKAEEFLSKYYKDNYAKSKQYTESDSVSIQENNPNEYFTYAQQANGYFFPENAYCLSISKQNGTIDSLSGSFRDVTFDSADGIISMDQALNAYSNAFQTTLSYVSVPKKLDLSAPEYQTYISKGYSYFYELKLAYTAQADPSPYSVDAKGGKPLYYDTADKDTLTYSDVKTGKEILELAQYGIGFGGGTFQKTKKLTQIDMVALLVSANGYLYNPADNASAADQLYQNAYNLGILKKNQRSDTKNITRAELVKTILSMSGYGKTAELPGIYVCSFKDQKSIPAQYYGYVAIAQGLGMIKGGSGGTFSPNATATREQAAVMFYNFMNR